MKTKLLIYKLFAFSILLMVVCVFAENFTTKPKGKYLIDKNKIIEYITIQNQKINNNN